MASIESIGGGAGQRGTFGSLKLTGDKELELLLVKLPEKVQTRVLKKAIRFAGKAIVKLQRDGIRRHNKSKQLQKSIGTKLKTYRSGNTVLIVGPRKGFVAENGERADKYAIAIERGWRGLSGRTPDPFMRLSFAKGKRTVLGDFKKGIGNGIEKEAAKLAKKR